MTIAIEWNPISRPASAAAATGAVVFAAYVGINNNQFLFLDYINLAFHEFGHLFFGVAGGFIGLLGGTLAQVLIPIGLALVFVTRREIPGTGFCLLWTGESLINVSVYVADAREMGLPLVGGGLHDWNVLLGRFHLLEYDTILAAIVKALGWTIITVVAVSLIYTAIRIFQEPQPR